MPTCRKIAHASWITLTMVLASIGTAASQAYPQRDQPRITDQLRSQQEQSRQRLGDDLRRQLQNQDIQRQQIELEDRIRRQQLKDQLDRQQR